MRTRTVAIVFVAGVLASVLVGVGTLWWFICRSPVRVTETPLADLLEVRLKSVILSPDGRHVAYQAALEDGFVVVVDGFKSRPFDAIFKGSLQFSPDSRRWIFAGRRADRRMVVLDGVEGKGYESLGADGFVFSPDSKHVAYRAIRDDKWYVVFDGQEGPPYDGLFDHAMIFSPDSRRFAFACEHGDRNVVVVDGVESKPFTTGNQDGLRFSPDSRHLVSEVRIGDKMRIVTDGVDGELYDMVSHVRFSPDSKRMVYAAGLGKKQVAVIDGVEGPLCDGVIDGHPIFSPDSKHVAYVALSDGGRRVVLDGVEQPLYSLVGERSTATMKGERNVYFSPDSRHVAYAAWMRGTVRMVMDGVPGKAYQRLADCRPVYSPDSSHFAYTVEAGDNAFMVLDGVEGPPCKRIDPDRYVFSPDSTRFAYAALVESGKTHADVQKLLLAAGPGGGPARECAYVVIIDGKAGPEFMEVQAGPVFSPDSTHVAYAAFRAADGDRKGGHVLVVDGMEQGTYDMAVRDITFSPDSKHLVYGIAMNTLRGPKHSYVVDGLPGGVYDDHLPASGFVFDGPARFHTVFVKGDKLVLVEVETGTGVAEALRAAPAGGPPGPMVEQPQWVDLLALVNPKADAVAGVWESKDGLTLAKSCDAARLAIPCEVDGDYQLRAEFDRTSGDADVVFILPVRGRNTALILAKEGGNRSGLWWAKDATDLVKPARLANNQTHVLEVTVRTGYDEALVTTQLDGRPYFQWYGPESSIGIWDVFQMANPKCVGLGSWNGNVIVFKSVKVRPLSGKATCLRTGGMPAGKPQTDAK
jgi:Tol biopolymer transport system component